MLIHHPEQGGETLTYPLPSRERVGEGDKINTLW